MFIGIGIIVVLAVIGGVFFVLKPSSSTEEASGEIFLEAAASQGQNSFSDGPLADQPDPTIALPATDAAPTVTGTVSATTSNGGQAGLYGGSLDSGICDTAKMIGFLESNPDKAQAWVGALNADPNLNWSGGRLTTADIPVYIGGLTPIILVNDTRVTNHGFANGQPTSFQSVLQKGSGVFVDAYGVPRVRCYCGNPLMAPKPSKSTPKYQGNAWPGFDPSKVGVVTSAGSPLTSFEVRIPARPNGAITKVPVGPKCGKQACPASLFVKGGNKQPSGSASPSASASQTGSFNPTLSVAATKKLPNGDVNYSVTLKGYQPGSTVSLTCGSSRQPNFYTTKVKINAQGEYTKNPFCYTPDPGFFVKDSTNNITARA